MRTAFVGATAIDCTGAPPIKDAVVLVSGKKIEAVGPKGKTAVPSDATVVDLAGMTVLPGLINTHDHLGLPDPEDPLLDYTAEARLLHSANGQYRQTFALRYGAQELRDGVTTVRILGERDFLDVGYKETFDRDLAPGPRVITGGPAIATSAQFHGTWVTVVADGPEALRAAVRKNIVQDVKVIKLVVSGGYRQGVPKGLTACYFTREELHAIMEEAHKFDVKVCAHLNGGIGVDWGIEAGLDGVEHGMNLTDRELEIVAKSDAYIGLTTGWFFTPLYKKLLGEQRAEVEKQVRRIYKSGAKIALGNDEVHQDHGMARQMILLVECDVPAKTVLEIATRQGAIACGVDRERGTLTAGLDADVIAVGGDPLADMRVMRDVRMVMKGGKIYHGVGAAAAN
jgi:imidazolonepropionase-like amidohydrolase